MKNTGTSDALCTFTYRGPERIDAPLISRETIPAGKTHIYEDFLNEIAAAGTVRVHCPTGVEVFARVQDSLDGAKTFRPGRLFRPFGFSDAIAAGGKQTIRANADLVLAEVAGRSAHVEVIATNAGGVMYGRKSYDVPPFAQRVVALDTVLDRLGRADVTIAVTSGEGKIAVGKETRDPALAKLALHHAAAETSARVVSVQSSGAVTPLLLFCPFKAAPFMDPATGLCFMRDRWYDPKTGTFLTPDRAGHRDSSNLYVFGKADPVNNHDPTGMTVALWGTQHQKDAAYKRLVGTLDNPAAVAHLTIDKQHRVAVTGISIDDFIKRYDGRARQLGQMIDSAKTVYLTEVQSTTPIASPFKRDELLQDKIERGGGGFFDTFDHAHGLAAFNPDLFPRDVADVTETSDATFVHEFFGHAYAWSVPYGATEAQTGTISKKYVYNAFTGGIGAGEADGLWAENTYRLQHQMRLRTYYLRARDDWNAPAWLAPYIQKQQQADVRRADQEAERRRQQLLQHNIWHWPGLR